MRSGRTRRGVLSIGLALLLTVGSVGVFVGERIPRVSAVEVDTTSYLNVTGTDAFLFSPDVISGLPLNTNITVTFTDAGSADHTFTILSYEGVSFNNNTSNIDPVAYPTGTSPTNGSGPGNLLNINATSAPGAFTQVFKSPATAGWYEFVCTEPGHFSLGMYGYISFGEPVPPGLVPTSSPTGPGAAVFIIVGTIVSLTVIAIVLGFVVGRRRGAAFEMPPERTGYPEAPGPGGSAGSNPPLSSSPPH
jgi:plastocyanin